MEKFIPPTLEQVLELAREKELPEREARKFYAYYDSVDWFVGKKRMVRVAGAMAGWKLRWEERQDGNGKPAINNYASTIVHQKELERVIEKMKRIRNTYSSHQAWCDNDLRDFHALKRRRDELMRMLDVKY